MSVAPETTSDRGGEPRAEQRPLFSTFPQLKSVVAVSECAVLPTPVQPMPFADHAWIKRDDLTHPEYGGNKIRKLEFILADARRKNARRIITFGAIGTNHGVATAMLCQKAGLECIVYLFDQPASSTVTQNLKLMQAYGATLLYKGSLMNTVRAYYLSPYRARRGSYFLFAGGSNVYGTLSFVNAAMELGAQIEHGDCPQVETIFCPVGSSATLAGLTYGCQLGGLDVRVSGIRVAPEKLGPFSACTQEVVLQQMNEVYHFMKQHVSQPLPAPRTPQLIGDYYGAGYGVATAKGEQAREKFKSAGINIEQTYTAKAAAAFMDQLERSEANTLFWNTYNSRDMSTRASSANVSLLPRKLQAFV